mgnify:CR=1 FL=1
MHEIDKNFTKEELNSDASYFNHPNVSNSDLGLLKKDPWLFYLTKNKKIEKASFDHFELGTLIHLAVLEPEKFAVADIDKPGGLMGVFLSHYIEAGMNDEAAKFAYKKSGFRQSLETIMNKLKDKDIAKYIAFMQTSTDKLVLTSSQKYVIDRAIDGVKRNPKAMEYLINKDKDKEYFNELSLFGIVNCTNGDVKIKGKPDRIIIDHKAKTIRCIDLKSTSSGPYFEATKINDSGDPRIDYIGTGFFGSFKGFEYYRQCAFYNQLIRQNFKELALKYTISNHIVPVNTTESFSCSVINVTEKWTNAGYDEMMHILQAYNEHKKKNDWKVNFFYPTTKGEIVI